MIRRFFSLFEINIVRIFCWFSSMITIIIFWSLLIHLMFMLKIICKNVWIWFFNIFCFVVTVKLDWILDFWFWEKLIAENRCFSIKNKKSVSNIIIELLEKKSSNSIEKSEHVVVDVFKLWALFLIDDVIVIVRYDLTTAAFSVNSESLIHWLKMWILTAVKFDDWAELLKKLINDVLAENNIFLMLISLKQESD